jgi:asparagine synthase (glutamine-hydrolysing)
MSTIHACFLYDDKVTDDTLQQMLSSSDYWRPDEKTIVMSQDQHCGLGKASLWQTTLSERDQAWRDDKSGLMICANARIDNRLVLGQRLDIDPEALQVLPDNQLLVRAYQKWGSDCPKYLLGDFAFIIWDEAAQEIYAARDHFGVKVLLLSQSPQGVMLSNEPKAFIQSGWVTPSIKERWLVTALSNNLSAPSEPIYHDLELVPAAHWVRASSQGVTVQRYWDLEDDNQYLDKDPDHLINLLKERFSTAVQRRLQTDFALSCELSEGLDSNGIAGFAAKLEPNRTIHTLSYQCFALNEQTKPVWEKTYQDIFEMLAMHKNLQAIWTDDRPDHKSTNIKLLKDTAGVFPLRGAWTWHCELASRQQSRVILSGWGGDHCVTTYGDFYDSELLSGFKLLKLNKLIRAKYRRGRGAPPVKAWLGLLMKHLAPNHYYKRVIRRGALERALWQRQQHSFVRPEWTAKHKIVEKLEAFTRYYQRKTVKAHHRRELFDIGVESRLIDSELSARQHRMEFRYPMLDVELVEIAYNLPSELKSYQGIERYPFRRVLEGVTTKRIQWRVKADVNFPNIDHFVSLTQEDKDALLETINKPPIRDYVVQPDFSASDQNAVFFFRQFLSGIPHYQYLIEHGIKVRGS